MISKEEIQHIAKLARLGLSESDVAKYQKELSAILGYVDKLKEADVEGVKPFTHSVDISNVLRLDEKIERTAQDSDKLKKPMPETKNGYLKVRSIF